MTDTLASFGVALHPTTVAGVKFEVRGLASYT